MKRNAVTLIEVILVVVILGFLLGGATCVLRGTAAQLSDNLIVNPYHNSTAKIKVLTTYFGTRGNSNISRNIYRVYAQVIWDSDVSPSEPLLDNPPCETFEVNDSFLDGNYRSSDIFGELKANEGSVFDVKLQGERSGISGQGTYRSITSATMVEE